MARIIQKEIFINKGKGHVFQALLTPTKICKWWNAVSAIVVPKRNGIFTVAWGPSIDSPDYIIISKIKEIVQNRLIVLTSIDYYYKLGDIPFHTNLESRLTLKKSKNGTLLQLTSTGFPDDKIADDFYKASCEGWEDALQSVKLFLE